VDAPMMADSSGPHPAALDAMVSLYAELDAVVNAHNPRCDASGRCCRFDSWGHQLFVSTLEMQYFAMRMGLIPVSAKADAGTAISISLPQYPVSGDCPWQIDGLCTAREARPLGCRIYFCDPANQDWQPELYEKFHRRILELHARFAMPYSYREWRSTLRDYRLQRSENDPVPLTP
jgi:Fe-S-cluster containining protein